MKQETPSEALPGTEENEEITVPGCRKNAMGHYVPESKIPDLDLLRDDLVNELAERAKAESVRVTDFKIEAMADVDQLVKIAAEEYGAKMGGAEGNITLTSFDGRYRVQRQVSKKLVFDERLQVAKSLIDECIHEWAKDANDNVKALVEHAFDTDSEGKLNIARVFGLLRLKIQDEKWMNAMEAIKDSIQISGSSTYLRFYEKSEDGWKPIAVDMKGV